jgi:hypothetical protein
MPQGRIAKRAVDELQCPSRKDRHFLWDDDLAGLGVGVARRLQKNRRYG